LSEGGKRPRPREPLAVRFSRILYGALVRLLPRSLRSRHEREMVDTFADLCQDAYDET